MKKTLVVNMELFASNEKDYHQLLLFKSILVEQIYEITDILKYFHFSEDDDEVKD